MRGGREGEGKVVGFSPPEPPGESQCTLGVAMGLDRWARSAAGRALHPIQGNNPTIVIPFCPRTELPPFPISFSFSILNWNGGGAGQEWEDADVLAECPGPSYCIPKGEDLEGRCLTWTTGRMCPQCTHYPPVSLLAGRPLSGDPIPASCQ